MLFRSPRGRDAGGYHKVLWVDAISQQALSAHCIVAMEQALGNEDEARKWNAEYEALKKKINHLYWDERLTTVEAERTLIENKVRREDRKKYIDKIAAVFILQGYLDSLAHTPLD